MGQFKVKVDAAHCKITSSPHRQHILPCHSQVSGRRSSKKISPAQVIKGRDIQHTRPGAHESSFTKVEDRLNAWKATEKKSQVSHGVLLGEKILLTSLPHDCSEPQRNSCTNTVVCQWYAQDLKDCKYCALREDYVSSFNIGLQGCDIQPLNTLCIFWNTPVEKNQNLKSPALKVLQRITIWLSKEKHSATWRCEVKIHLICAGNVDVKCNILMGEEPAVEDELISLSPLLSL